MNRLATAAIAAACGGVSACLYLGLVLGSPGALILVYLTQLPLFMAGLFGWPLLAVAVLGLLETWLGLRRRLAPQGVSIDG